MGHADRDAPPDPHARSDTPPVPDGPTPGVPGFPTHVETPFGLVRLWTLAEADAAVPRVEEMLTEARAILDQVQLETQAMEDLRVLWGDRVRDPACPGHLEWRRHVERAREARGRLGDTVEAFEDQGIFLKDLEQGLVDFPSLLGKEVVFLCYQSGEERVGHWHRLDEGFAGRHPVPDLKPDV